MKSLEVIAPMLILSGAIGALSLATTQSAREAPASQNIPEVSVSAPRTAQPKDEEGDYTEAEHIRFASLDLSREQEPFDSMSLPLASVSASAGTGSVTLRVTDSAGTDYEIVAVVEVEDGVPVCVSSWYQTPSSLTVLGKPLTSLERVCNTMGFLIQENSNLGDYSNRRALHFLKTGKTLPRPTYKVNPFRCFPN